MTAKDQTNWSPEQLEEWARPALEYPELIEIARTAASNNEAKKKALEWVTKTHENLGQACRWLRILRVKDPARFEKLISQIEQKPGKKGETMREKQFEIIELPLKEKKVKVKVIKLPEEEIHIIKKVGKTMPKIR
jgi:restriction endonuclease Mrr